MRYAERSRAVVSFQNAKSPLFALLPERPTDQLLVVDDENLFRRHCVTLEYYAGAKTAAAVSVTFGAQGAYRLRLGRRTGLSGNGRRMFIPDGPVRGAAGFGG